MVQLSLRIQAAAYAGAHGIINQGIHPLARAQQRFAQGGGIDVSIDFHRYAQGLTEGLGQGIIPPAGLGRGGNAAIIGRVGIQAQGAEAAHAQGFNALFPEKPHHIRHGFRRFPGGKADSFENIAVFIAEHAHHLGAAGLQCAQFHWVFPSPL